ncbi:hypothetical protein DFH28DRAFT_1065101 [Melampsora americana]|nr:hypothetical protein DFH28DRAFT_1065101 [Melampsora americana]
MTPTMSPVLHPRASPCAPATSSQPSSIFSMSANNNNFFMNSSGSSLMSPLATVSLTDRRSPVKRSAEYFDSPLTQRNLSPDVNDLTQVGWDPTVVEPAKNSSQIDANPEDEERTFQVYFNLWQLQVPDPHPAKRGKRPAGGSRPSAVKPAKLKYANYNPKLPTKLLIRPKQVQFLDFKKQLFASCNKQLEGVSEGLGQAFLAGGLTLQGYINSYPKNKGKELIDITDGSEFPHFVKAALNAPASTAMGVRIVHKNPIKTDLARRALQSVRKDLADSCGSGESDAELSVSSQGSAILSLGERHLRTLMQRFKNDFKRGENVTSIPNPADPGLVLLLNTSRIRTWANDWADGVRGVDEVNPPMMRPEFKWIPVANYDSERNALLGLAPPKRAQPNFASDTSPSGPSVVHHNYYGQSFPSAVPPPMYSGSGSASQAHPLMNPPIPCDPRLPSVSRLSPPPGKVDIDFDHFLVFAGISPDMLKVREALAKEGIHEFRRLLDRNTYSIAVFHSWGIPFAQAEDIWKAIPKYNHHLKSL